MGEVRRLLLAIGVAEGERLSLRECRLTELGRAAALASLRAHALRSQPSLPRGTNSAVGGARRACRRRPPARARWCPASPGPRRRGRTRGTDPPSAPGARVRHRRRPGRRDRRRRGREPASAPDHARAGGRPAAARGSRPRTGSRSTRCSRSGIDRTRPSTPSADGSSRRWSPSLCRRTSPAPRPARPRRPTRPRPAQGPAGRAPPKPPLSTERPSRCVRSRDR